LSNAEKARQAAVNWEVNSQVIHICNETKVWHQRRMATEVLGSQVQTAGLILR